MKIVVRIVIIASILIGLSSGSGFSQERTTGVFKRGDRVLADIFYTGEYKMGTVVAIVGEGDRLTCCMYTIKIDNDDPLWKDGRTLGERNIKPAGAATNNTAANKQNTGGAITKTNVNEVQDFNALAYRKIVDCPIDQKIVKANAPPDAALLKKIIQCLFERKAPQGMTGAKTMDITAFQLGTARKWRPLDDIGSGNLNTMVHPIKVTWTEKTYYETFTQQIDNISMFNCYVNAVGEWECGLAQRLKESEIKRIPR